jgi:DNA modification methylase
MPRSSRQLQKLALTYLTTSSLTEDPRNTRAHGKHQIAALARSIETFGFNVPILIDASSTVIAGHGRLAAAKMLGLEEVPTVSLEHLTEQQRRAYMIADNRLTDLSRWDDKLLGETLRDLSFADLDFDLDAIGFSVGEIDLRIEGLSDPDQNAAEDELPALQVEAVTKPGDCWKLGPHRLLCGDALEEQSWMKLMEGKLAAAGFTDPPYNVKIHGFVSGLGKHRHREFAQGAGEMDRDQFAAFLETALRRMAKHSEKASIHFIAMDWRHSSELLAAGECVFTELKNICVWSKQPGMGSLYRSAHEFFFVWKNGRGRHQNNVELGRHGRSRSNIWAYPVATAFRHSEGTDLLATHPTCKPVALVADAILDVSKRGEIVIDPFLGSGTTIIAAERVGRVCMGLELDPIYCDAIIRRFEALTGQQAIHEDGRAFGEISAERLSNLGEAA